MTLLDTNILLHSRKSTDPMFPMIQTALNELTRRG